MRSSSMVALLGAAFFAFAGCSSETRTLEKGRFTIETAEGGGTFEVRDCDRVLLRAAGIPAQRLRFAAEAPMQFGLFTFAKETTSETNLVGARIVDGALELGNGALKLIPRDHGERLTFDVQPGSRADGWRLRFDCSPHREFMGFGEQYSYLTMKGRRVPIWTEENGLTRAEQPVMPFQGNLFSTYFPMPWFLDPRGMGFISDSTAYQEFSLCEEGDVWSVDVWDKRPFRLHVLAGPEPLDVISQLTDITGKPAPLPEWGFDLWLSAQGGDEAVRHAIEQADEAGIPWSVVWAQDWVGRREFSSGFFGVKYRWALDNTFYTDLPGLIEELHSRDKRFLGYFNPFIPPDFDFYEEGREKGYLIRNAEGEPYLFTVSVFEASLVDLTNPEAVEWFKHWARKAVDLGLDGWMSDFGEWLPWDAVLYEGEAAYEHNLYPTRWHQASRDVLDEKRPDGDYILLTRSGHLREPGVAQVVWAGDQEVNWDRHDGLPTAIKAIVSLSLSGVPYVTHDIAGFSGGPSTPELWKRWVEFGAFTPIMRLHDGIKKYENWNYMKDTTSAAFLARFAELHGKLKPYLVELSDHALATGHPIVRHPILIENDEHTLELDDQYFLGDDLLVAPVVKPGRDSRTVYFTSGRWIPVFGGDIVEGPGEKEVPAPLGSPAVYAREGSRVAGLLQ